MAGRKSFGQTPTWGIPGFSSAVKVDARICVKIIFNLIIPADMADVTLGKVALGQELW